MNMSIEEICQIIALFRQGDIHDVQKRQMFTTAVNMYIQLAGSITEQGPKANAAYQGMHDIIPNLFDLLEPRDIPVSPYSEQIDDLANVIIPYVIKLVCFTIRSINRLKELVDNPAKFFGQYYQKLNNWISEYNPGEKKFRTYLSSATQIRVFGAGLFTFRPNASYFYALQMLLSELVFNDEQNAAKYVKPVSQLVLICNCSCQTLVDEKLKIPHGQLLQNWPDAAFNIMLNNKPVVDWLAQYPITLDRPLLERCKEAVELAHKQTSVDSLRHSEKQFIRQYDVVAEPYETRVNCIQFKVAMDLKGPRLAWDRAGRYLDQLKPAHVFEVLDEFPIQEIQLSLLQQFKMGQQITLNGERVEFPVLCARAMRILPVKVCADIVFETLGTIIAYFGDSSMEKINDYLNKQSLKSDDAQLALSKYGPKLQTLLEKCDVNESQAILLALTSQYKNVHLVATSSQFDLCFQRHGDVNALMKALVASQQKITNIPQFARNLEACVKGSNLFQLPNDPAVQYLFALLNGKGVDEAMVLELVSLITQHTAAFMTKEALLRLVFERRPDLIQIIVAQSMKRQKLQLEQMAADIKAVETERDRPRTIFDEDDRLKMADSIAEDLRAKNKILDVLKQQKEIFLGFGVTKTDEADPMHDIFGFGSDNVLYKRMEFGMRNVMEFVMESKNQQYCEVFCKLQEVDEKEADEVRRAFQ